MGGAKRRQGLVGPVSFFNIGIQMLDECLVYFIGLVYELGASLHILAKACE